MLALSYIYLLINVLSYGSTEQKNTQRNQQEEDANAMKLPISSISMRNFFCDQIVKHLMK